MDWTAKRGRNGGKKAVRGQCVCVCVCVCVFVFAAGAGLSEACVQLGFWWLWASRTHRAEGRDGSATGQTLWFSWTWGQSDLHRLPVLLRRQRDRYDTAWCNKTPSHSNRLMLVVWCFVNFLFHRFRYLCLCNQMCNRFAGGLFFWGVTNTSRESTMYPKAVQDLCGWKIRSLACGWVLTSLLLSLTFFNFIVLTKRDDSPRVKPQKSGASDAFCRCGCSVSDTVQA